MSRTNTFKDDDGDGHVDVDVYQFGLRGMVGIFVYNEDSEAGVLLSESDADRLAEILTNRKR